MAQRRLVAMVAALAVQAASVAQAAAAGWEACEIPSMEVVATGGGQQQALRLAAGVEPQRVWLTASYDGLSIRKFTAKGGASVIEFSYGDDTVVISLSRDQLSIGRKGVAREFKGQRSMEDIQALLGASPAVYRTRLMLSQLERTSALKAGTMSVLSAAALLASLTGDVDAPARLSERFLEKHRRGYALVRAVVSRSDDEDSCWSSYTKETEAAWKSQESCVKEQTELGWFLLDSRINACMTVWFLRAESAWFEFLKCTGLTSLPKIQ